MKYLTLYCSIIISFSSMTLFANSHNRNTGIEVGEVGTTESNTHAMHTNNANSTAYCQTIFGNPPLNFTVWSDIPKRKNQEAETLALESSKSFYATELDYQQSLNDLRRIRNNYSEDRFTQVTATPCSNLSSFMIHFDDTAIEEFRAGNYWPWDGLNKKFGLASAEEIGSLQLVIARFKRRYFISTLIDQYEEAALPGILSISSNSFYGASGDVCKENRADSKRIYIFYKGSGDCPAGCMYKSYSGYQVNQDDTIQHLGVYAFESDEPSWFANSQKCRAFLP